MILIMTLSLTIAAIFLLLGPIIGFVAFLSLMIMLLAEPPSRIVRYIGLGSLLAAILASFALTAWLTTPWYMAQIAYYKAAPDSIIHI